MPGHARAEDRGGQVQLRRARPGWRGSTRAEEGQVGLMRAEPGSGKRVREGLGESSVGLEYGAAGHINPHRQTGRTGHQSPELQTAECTHMHGRRNTPYLFSVFLCSFRSLPVPLP